jgi:hypothetical protein
MLFSAPAKIAEAGERIYAEKYQASLEGQHPGEFVVIDVLNGNPYVARFPEQALEQARSCAPMGVFHLIRIGSPGAFRVSHVSAADGPDHRLFHPLTTPV